MLLTEADSKMQEVSSTCSQFTKATTDVTYKDYANITEVIGPVIHHIKENKLVDNPFPVKLHYMLSEVEKDGLANIVSWQPHGRCFIVHNQKEFVKQILPCWFRQSKLASFQRQLNLYGFQRLTTGKDKGGYYHELFLKGMQNLCYLMKRTKVKGTRIRQPSKPETQPNFYLMPYVTSAITSSIQSTTSSITPSGVVNSGLVPAASSLCTNHLQQQSSEASAADALVLFRNGKQQSKLSTTVTVTPSDVTSEHDKRQSTAHWPQLLSTNPFLYSAATAYLSGGLVSNSKLQSQNTAAGLVEHLFYNTAG